MSKIKERLIQVFENQNIRISEVVKKISVSEKYFYSSSEIRSDVLEIISQHYPIINMDYVVTGRGDRLKPLKDSRTIVAEPQTHYISRKKHPEAVAAITAQEKAFNYFITELDKLKSENSELRLKLMDK